MSYDIYLEDPVTKNTIEVRDAHFMRGGTYKVGGNTLLELNVTCNYSTILHRVMDGGIRGLYGKTGLESVKILENAIQQLSDDASDDYWEATGSNVKRALIQLKTMAHMAPHGVWNGD